MSISITAPPSLLRRWVRPLCALGLLIGGIFLYLERYTGRHEYGDTKAHTVVSIEFSKDGALIKFREADDREGGVTTKQRRSREIDIDAKHLNTLAPRSTIWCGYEWRYGRYVWTNKFVHLAFTCARTEGRTRPAGRVSLFI